MSRSDINHVVLRLILCPQHLAAQLLVLSSQHFYLTFHTPPVASMISANTTAYSQYHHHSAVHNLLTLKTILSHKKSNYISKKIQISITAIKILHIFPKKTPCTVVHNNHINGHLFSYLHKTAIPLKFFRNKETVHIIRMAFLLAIYDTVCCCHMLTNKDLYNTQQTTPKQLRRILFKK